MRIIPNFLRYIGMLLFFIVPFVAAHDGLITLKGKSVVGTCVFDGVSTQAGDTPSSGTSITLPAVSADMLANNERAGETRLYFHFRNCPALVGQSSFAVTFYSTNVSTDGELFLPDSTPDSASNVGLDIKWGNTVSYQVYPNRSPNFYGNFAFLSASGEQIVSDQYRVAYKKVPGSGAVIPGKVNTTVTYEIVYR
ncbi:fimbrial protein [Klebsiella spallanzanii]|uniref:fimbrial protein n=1 Tax=Klebsiella spallanzanii TaxID=2587528 RepID=UPI00115AA106|nr:fimbrial protein [Klebsiella spallanzanii]VUS96375.1 hypothetical protein SB6419_01524 [Klebsiella spallanzanii]